MSEVASTGLVRGVMAAGAKGYILKDDTSALIDLANVVLTVASGGFYVSQKIRQGFLSNGTSMTGNAFVS